MTQEEKARAYDEALERAKKVKHDVENIGCAMAPDMLEVIFPELAESEDERMLRTIIRGFENWKGSGNMTFNNTKVDDILAYLEKQKEQKPVEWSEKDEEMMSNILAVLSVYINYTAPHSSGSGTTGYKYQEEMDWLFSIREKLVKENEK